MAARTKDNGATSTFSPARTSPLSSDSGRLALARLSSPSKKGWSGSEVDVCASSSLAGSKGSICAVITPLNPLRGQHLLGNFRLAAGRVDAKRLRLLDEICRAGYQSEEPKSIARFLEANKEFHVVIAQAAGNARLVHSIDQLLDEMTRLLHLGLGVRNRSQEMQHEHRTLLRALVRGEGATAEQICREQIETARDMVLKAIMNSRAVMNFAITADV
jgi:hypothetical protein